VQIDIDHIKKPELLSLYRRCGDHLHIGSFKSFPLKYSRSPDFKTVEDALPKIARLLKFHRIMLLAPDEELWVWMKWGEENKVKAELIAPA
jgi:hypothetical protein